jgi:hypothetical protein
MCDTLVGHSLGSTSVDLLDLCRYSHAMQCVKPHVPTSGIKAILLTPVGSGVGLNSGEMLQAYITGNGNFSILPYLTDDGRLRFVVGPKPTLTGSR